MYYLAYSNIQTAHICFLLGCFYKKKYICCSSQPSHTMCTIRWFNTWMTCEIGTGVICPQEEQITNINSELQTQCDQSGVKLAKNYRPILGLLFGENYGSQWISKFRASLLTESADVIWSHFCPRTLECPAKNNSCHSPTWSNLKVNVQADTTKKIAYSLTWKINNDCRKIWSHCKGMSIPRWC